MTKEREKILEVENLCTKFHTERGDLKAIDGVSFHVYKGEILGIVGESGCGKSVTSQSILRLYDEKRAASYEGEVRLEGENLFSLSEKNMQKIRGEKIAMVFQDALSSLNPVFTVGSQIMEALLIHQKISRNEAVDKSIDLLRLVGIPEAEKRFTQYPHQLSGGMRQRVMIAIALACHPKLLIADEPTTALDVTIQAQILRILKKLAEESDTSVILITHDMGVVAEMADHVMVMYAGKSVEYGTAEDIFDHPMHPYTVGLLKSIPKLGSGQEDHLFTIEGTVPGLDEMPAGCRFSTRCPYATEQCKKEDPGMQGEAGHFVRCFRFMDPEIQDSREVE